MKLRTRLMIALIVVSTIGLVIFGVVTSTLYQRSLVDQLDQQLVSASRPQAGRLQRIASSGLGASTCSSSSNSSNPSPNDGGSAGFVDRPQDFDVEAHLFESGKQIACIPALGTTGSPLIPTAMRTTTHSVAHTVASTSQGVSWRVLAMPINEPGLDGESQSTGLVVVVARPTAALEESLNRLAKIELATGAGLLLALAIGAWLVLRRGLHPLEQMAASTTSITAGDLSKRVTPADTATEIGQLGLALNTMLDGIEDAFREREETERRLRQFLADASHELRTPITSIQGFAELFRLNKDQPTQDLDIIMRRIEGESARMRTLVEDLLLLARLDRTRQIAPTSVDLSVLAADACTDAAAVDPTRPLTLNAPSPAVTMGDADHLRQAIANLVSNALRHTPAGTPIEVSTTSDEHWATVHVRDHGSGLDAEGLEHAFDRFWQADGARVGTGVGLGLSIVAGIAAEHDGRIAVENCSDGGARFSLSLPIKLREVLRA